MKNITFFINTLSAAGGTQRVLTSLANGLVEKYNITIIVLDEKKPFFKIKSEIKIKKIFRQEEIYIALKNNKTRRVSKKGLSQEIAIIKDWTLNQLCSIEHD